MKSIVIAGSLILDVVKRIDVWPARGMLANISHISRAVGGCVPNTAIDLKRLCPALSVRAMGRLGSDEAGTFILEKLEGEGIDTAGILRKGETSFSDVMTLASTGERTFFQCQGANAEFSRADIDVTSLNCDLFHLGYLLLLDELDAPDAQYGTAAAHLLHDVRKRGIDTCIDLVSAPEARFHAALPALKYCSYIVVNEIEGGLLTGIDPRGEDGEILPSRLEAICRALIGMGVEKTAAVHCPEMSCAATKEEVTFLPSLKLPAGYIRSAVGAGDAFCAGMLYSFLFGLSPMEGMKIASCAAACNLSAPDGVSGARTLEETMRLETKFGRY